MFQKVLINLGQVLEKMLKFLFYLIRVKTMNFPLFSPNHPVYMWVYLCDSVWERGFGLCALVGIADRHLVFWQLQLQLQLQLRRPTLNFKCKLWLTHIKALRKNRNAI